MVLWVSHTLFISDAFKDHHLLHWCKFKQSNCRFPLSFRKNPLKYFITDKPQTKNQVCWFIVAFTFVGLIPYEPLRLWVNNKVFLIAFRIITRSLSAVVLIHNEEYKPKNCGFCVANHTSPIDVAILSTDCTYSLVRVTININMMFCCTLNMGIFLCHIFNHR